MRWAVADEEEARKMASADETTSPVPEANGGSSGEFVLKKLFAEFVAVSEKKLEHVCSQPLEYSLAKALVRGEDAQFDQILSALNEVSSFCLRSVLTVVFKWRNMQMEQCPFNPESAATSSSEAADSPFPPSKKERVHQVERWELAVEFIFCLVLVEVMPRLSVHPVPESFIHNIEDLAFKHFKQQESLKDHRAISSPNVTNMRKIADLYAEVIGVLSQARFHSVRRRFFLEIRNPDHSSATIISIIEGMSFIRVKMFPVEELEQWFVFLQECAQYFLDCPREKIKAAMGALLVEILLPVAAVINVEVSLPVAKRLVSMLYGHCTEHARRARYSNTYLPLATVLLAISEQSFFLNNWHVFLVQNLLPSLKRGDTKIHTIALVSLYRLIWVYMVRIKGESNKTTMLRLRTVVDTLFPRGQRGVVPKEMPLNIFVKLIQFIARERLEYAMQEVILELLSQGKTKTAIYPERMIIGLRAFLMITDSLEKKEGDPPMPINPGPLPSRGLSRVKNRFLSNTLSNETAKKIGIIQFYPGVRRALDGILRSLDHHVGRQLTSTNPQPGKSVEEVLGTVKPKLDLLKTCVAAIPRILPENMSRDYLTDLLSRLTIHLDHELGRAAANSLHCFVTNYPVWRHSIVRVFVQFLLRDVPDSCPLVLEATLKLLIQFVRDWRQMVTSAPDKQAAPSDSCEDDGKNDDEQQMTEEYCIPWVEACGLVTLCSYRSVTRRLSLVLLKEVRSLHEALAGQPNRVEETAVMDVIESATPVIIKRYLSTLSVNQRTELRVSNQSLTLTWLADRAACFLEQGGSRAAMRDPWALCLAGLMEPTLFPQACKSATQLAWPYLYQRMMKAYMILDPAGLVADKGDKPSSMRGKGRPIVSSVETFLWRNYLICASCSAPPSSSSSSTSQDTSHEISGQHNLTAKDLFQRVVPLIRWDGEIREVAVTALGLVHPPAFGDLVEQLQPVIHDALEPRKDVKRRRRREALKIQITRVLSLAAEHGCFQHSRVARTEHGQLSNVMLDFIEGIRSHFDSEKDGVYSYPELRLHFAGLVANIINAVPRGESRVLLLSALTRQGLFYLFATWCGLWQRPDAEVWSRNPQISFNSLQAMSALLCSGPVFQTDSLDQKSQLYCWLDNMLVCKEVRVQALGQQTVQLLMANNSNSPTLLHWVVDRCYDSQPGAAQLCFCALASNMENFPDYPCDMVTILHVALFKIADPDNSMREKAMQLLQLLDARFLSESGSSRPHLLSCLTRGAYSPSHVIFSKELATTNPELTVPLFSEMVYRFEMSSHSGQRSILQHMVPWLANVELFEETQNSPYISQLSPNHTSWPRPSSAILRGTGWGSLDATKLVLHNLLYITAKYGEEHAPEVESLWTALCSWQNNLRITINYLARLLCACGNMEVMVQHAKRIMVSFSRFHSTAIIAELIRDLQSVEIISAELQPTDLPPFFCVVGSQTEGKRGQEDEMEEEGWTVKWRSAVKESEGSPVALPVPCNKQYFANLKSLLNLPVRQLIPLHRCNFALMILSELVLEIHSEVDWSEHLPLMLHVALLGLDLMRPLVYEHSKALLANLVVVVACRNNMLAALQARLLQQEISARPPSPPSATGTAEPSLVSRDTEVLPQQTSSTLINDAQEVIKFISQRDSHRSRWPFADVSSRLAPCGEVPDLSALVDKIIKVFSHTGPPDLKEKWAKKALNWATSCSSHQYASQSFQVCRALRLPLSPPMFREILTRLAESASDTNEDMQSYVLEIVLTLECALDHLPLEHRKLTSVEETGQQTASLPPADEPPPPKTAVEQTPLSPPPTTDGVRRHHRVRSITSKQDMVPQRPASAHARIQSPLPVVVTPLPTGQPDTHFASQTCTGNRGTVEDAELKECAEEQTVSSLELADEEQSHRLHTKVSPLLSSQNLQLSGVHSRTIATEHFHAFSDTMALTPGDDCSLSSRLRKGSEPPPSLVGRFERDDSTRTHKQWSYEEESVHLKQHSLDSSHLAASHPQGSPHHSRRMKSPILSSRKADMTRTPSHPHLHQTASTPPLTKAHSIQQLRAVSPSELEEGRNQRSYSGGGEDMKRLKPQRLQRQRQLVGSSSRDSLHSSNASSVASLKVRSEAGKDGNERVKMMSVDSVPMRSPAKSSSDLWRRNSSQIGLRKEVVIGGRGGIRPHSMVETSSLRPHYPMELNPTPAALVAQMFWTAVSLLESDFEAEFSMALRLVSKCLEKLDLSQSESWERLQSLLPKFKWANFPGVQALLLKGLTLESVAHDTRSLLVLIMPFSTRPIFDPTQHCGLPLNIVALMPVLVHHFSCPTPFCLKAVASIRQACEAVELLSEDGTVKLQHMSRMFQMYSEGEFATGCDVWLAGICRYLNEAYSSLSAKILTLLSMMLEQGPDTFHRPVLRLLYEYLRLQEPLTHRMQAQVNSIMMVVHRHLAGPLWKEAVDLLKLAVASSAALVQPPTRSLQVDLGLFNHTLPGPTLQFKMNLQPNSRDLGLAHESVVESSWKNPAGSQRYTRERLLSVIKACIPIPVLMSSPSVVFTDEQALIEKATIQSSASDEASSSLTSVPGDLSSQPEAQSLIADEFNFLDNMEYIYDSSSESEAAPGPFSRPGEKGEVGEEEEEEESLSDSETLPLQLSMSDLEHSTALSFSQSPEKSLPSLPYDPQSLSSQLLTLSQHEETLLEEEEPEEPLPLSSDSLHRHEYSHASTLTGGSPESHEVSLECGQEDSLLEKDEEWSREPARPTYNEEWSREPARPTYSEEWSREPARPTYNEEWSREPARPTYNEEWSREPARPTYSEEWSREPARPMFKETPPAYGGIFSDSESSRDSSYLVAESGRNGQEPVTHSARYSAEGRWQSEPPGEGRVRNGAAAAAADTRQLSAPPLQTRSPSVEVVSESGETGETGGVHSESHAIRQLSEPPTKATEPRKTRGDNRGGSEPPPNGRTGGKPADDVSEPVVHQSLAEGREPNGAGAEPLTETGRAVPEISQPLAELREMSEPVSREQLDVSQGAAAQGRAASEPPHLTSRSFDDNHPWLQREGSSVGESSDQNCSSTEMKEDPETEAELSTSSSAALAGSEDQRCEPGPSEEADAVEVEEGGVSVEKKFVTRIHNPASQFICLSNEEVVGVWKRHVASLSSDRPETQAVHTHFLFTRLFPVLRQQFTVLTREACNYLGTAYSAVAAHFLVTVELLCSQLQLPSVYIDSELLMKVKLVESHVFLTLELDGNLDVYYERKKTVLKRLELTKLQLRQQSTVTVSEDLSEEQVEGISLSPEQATLQLCQAVHRLHFQLLVVLGSYIKLLHSLQPHLADDRAQEMSVELTEVRKRVEESVQLLGRVPSPLLEQTPPPQPVPEAVRALEDALSQRQWSQAVQLLRAVRRQNRGVALFGTSEDDDVDCLFYIYSRYITDSQEGVLCITSGNCELSDVHSCLMAQNVSLHSLLEASHQTLTLSP